MKDINRWVKGIVAAILVISTAFVAYQIVHHAHWLVGDDFYLISSLGWGHFCSSSILINPETGRFAPLVAMHYNILPLFFNGHTSPMVVYLYHAMWFCVFSFVAFYLLLDIQARTSSISSPWRYLIALLGTLFLQGRFYSEFAVCSIYSWFWDATLTMLLMLFSWLFYSKKKSIYGVIAFLIVAYSTYCSEVLFVAPLAWGICALPLWRNSTRVERIFHIGLILNAVVYLGLYCGLILPHVSDVYDSSHGSNASMIENAIHIFIVQKFFWISIIVFVLRIYEILTKKDKYQLLDVLLLAAIAQCCAGFILRLQGSIYFNRVIVIALPAVLLYLVKRIRPWQICVVFGALAMFYGAKLYIENKRNIQNRTEAWNLITTTIDTSKEIDLPIYFCELSSYDGDTYYSDIVDWQYACFERYYAWAVGDENATLSSANSYDDQSGIYVVSIFPTVNNIVVDNANSEVINSNNLLVATSEMAVYLYTKGTTEKE